jgi:hypothetical protein
MLTFVVEAAFLFLNHFRQFESNSQSFSFEFSSRDIAIARDLPCFVSDMIQTGVSREHDFKIVVCVNEGNCIVSQT